MAQAKRRRRKKRRGTQAGTIDPRKGKRGRPRTRAEARARAQGQRKERVMREPTLRSSSWRAAFAAALFFVVVVFIFKQKLVPSLVFSLIAFLIYVPVSYWTDRFMYRRHLRKQAQKKAKGE